MSKRGPLPGFTELLLLWIAHLAGFAVLAWKGYLGVPQCWAIFMGALVAFLSGARVERYRAKLEEKLEGSDGSD